MRRYVENGDEEVVIDVKSVWKELAEIEKERDMADKKVERFIKELKY